MISSLVPDIYNICIFHCQCSDETANLVNFRYYSEILKMKNPDKPLLIVILGHTAGGKTAFAASLAQRVNGEIISADSRQVYRGMDIGTGKDYHDYVINGEKIKVHLVDIADPGYEYNVYEFQKDFIHAWHDIRSANKQVLLCGGTGLYLDAVLKQYRLINVPVNNDLRNELVKKNIDELTEILRNFKNLHNKTDIVNKKRLIRAIEIETYLQCHPTVIREFPDFRPLVLGIRFSRDERRNRITQRLKDRLKSGMIEEVEGLINSGVSKETLVFYGLEYKYLAWYLEEKFSYDEMFEKLNTAIHQFAKRQMTWFRKMEREGVQIHWIDGEKDMEEKISVAMKLYAEYA